MLVAGDRHKLCIWTHARSTPHTESTIKSVRRSTGNLWMQNKARVSPKRRQEVTNPENYWWITDDLREGLASCCRKLVVYG